MWKWWKSCVLWISNHACGRVEIAQFCRIAAYYEYQITCVAVGKCQNCAELFRITKNKSRRSREEIAQKWKLLFVTKMKSRSKSHKSENCCLLRKWNRVCISRENKELYGIKRNNKDRIVFLDVAKRQEYYGAQALLRIKKTCGYGKSIVSPILK